MKLEIKAPCPENWDGMTPDAAGRYCPACAKSVHDFTGKPKEELLAFLLCSTQSPCVRMLASQQHFTAGEVQETAQKLIRSGKSIPAAALALVMLFATSCGTEESKPETHSKESTEVEPSKRPHYLQNLNVPTPIRPTMGFVAPTLLPIPKTVCPPIDINEPVLLGEPVMMGAPPMPENPEPSGYSGEMPPAE